MLPPHQAARPAAVHREDDPLGVRIHGAAGAKLERPEVFWARKAEEEKRLRRPIGLRSEAQCAGPVQVEIERREDNRIAARRVTIAGQTSERLYAYDEANRLTHVREGRNPLERYEYDRLGRRTVEYNVLRGLAGRSFRYDLSDRLLSAGEARYGHDAHGFRCAKEEGGRVTRYFYTSEGLLRRVALPDGRAIEYAYDRQGRRTAKAVDGRVVERYAWKGNRLVGWSDGEKATFHYADGRVPTLMVRDGEKYRLCCDQVGTVFAVLDGKNRLVKVVERDAFGNVVADSNPQLRLPFGFAGGLHDPDTGLIRFGARDYDPDTGRWTAKDPLGKAGGDRDLYRYCLADPVNLVDPSGLLFEFWTNPEVPEEQGSGQGEESQGSGQEESDQGAISGGGEGESPTLKDMNPFCKKDKNDGGLLSSLGLQYECDENGSIQGDHPIFTESDFDFMLKWPSELWSYPFHKYYEWKEGKNK